MKIFEAGGVSSTAASVPWQEGRGHTEDCLIPSHTVKSATLPQGLSDISVIFTLSVLEQSKPRIRSGGGISAVGNSLKGQKIDQA